MSGSGKTAERSSWLLDPRLPTGLFLLLLGLTFFLAWKDPGGRIGPLLSLLLLSGVLLVWNRALQRRLACSQGEFAVSGVQDRDREKLFQDILDAMPEMIWVKDPGGAFLVANQALADLVDVPREEILGGTDYDFFTQEKADFYRARDREALEAGGTRTNEESADFSQTGHSIWLETSKTPLFDAQGELVGVLGVGREIARRGLPEREGEERQAFLDRLVDLTPFPMYIGSPEGTLLRANPALYQALGTTAEEVVGRYNLFQDPNLHSPEAAQALERLREEGEWVRFELSWTPEVVPDVSFSVPGTLTLDVSAYPLLGPDGETAFLVVQWLDISDRKRAELEREDLLHQTRERAKELACLYRVSEILRARSCTEEALQEVVERIPAGWQYPEITRCRIRVDGAEVLSSSFEEGAWKQEAEIVVGGVARGAIEVFYLEEQPELDEGPFLEEERDLVEGLARMLGEALENARLDAERTRLVQAIEQSSETVMIVDGEGRIEYVNRAFEEVSGYPREEALGRTPDFLRSGEHPPEFYHEIRDRLVGGETWSGRMVSRKKDGECFTEEVVVSPVRDEQGRIIHYVAVKRDVTKELILESQLRQAQKMEAVGRLAGGVAHDFNNMLSIILGLTDLILDQTDPSQPTHADLLGIRAAGERSSDLTRQLLAFARKQTVQPRVIDLEETVGGMIRMLRRLIGEDIELLWRPGEGGWRVRIDPGQIDQVLANLCVNSRDALAGGGRVTIRTENVHRPGDSDPNRPETPAGDYVLLAVEDDGCGMDAETRARVFEPFFTTKEMGKGTGLGLATVYGIVQQNRGFLELDSASGEGTCLRIFLPRHLSEEHPEPAARPREEPARGEETVLVVEDEAAILELAGRMLRGQGYRVLSAGSPEEALGLAEDHDGDLHLLLTDVIMPGMNGRELAEKLLGLYPGGRCLFMSGYTAEALAPHGILEEGVEFLPKPFTRRRLLERVRQVLDG